jgi:hypothetical protein
MKKLISILFICLFVLINSKVASAESQECLNEKIATAYTGADHRTQSCIKQEEIRERFGQFFKVALGFLGLLGIGLLYQMFEAKVLSGATKKSEEVIRFESKLKEFGWDKPICNDNNTTLNKMLKSDLVDYAKNQGAAVNSKDTKMEIIEELLRLKLNKELKADLINYCGEQEIYIFSRDTKAQIIEKLIQAKKE